MVTTSGSYEEKGAEYFTHHDQQEKQRRLVKQLERLGYTVNLTPQRSA
jgi:transposase